MAKQADKATKSAAKKPEAKAPEAPAWKRRLLKIALVLGITGAVLSGAGAIGAYFYFAHGLPDFESVKDYKPPQATRVLAADGSTIAVLYHEYRTVIPLDQVSPVLIKAVLAAEDADFYKHEGLDYVGMLRAIFNSLKAGRVTGSGSTITQQTVKNLLLTPERSFRRKAREIVLARRLEAQLSKDDILTIYLNAIYLGHGRYGVQAASQYFFGKDASKIELDEAALLAGVIQSPENHSPRKHPESALSRRKYVLDQMVEKEFITAAEAAKAQAKPIKLAEPDEEWLPSAKWFLDDVKRQLLTELDEATLYEGGLVIHTTLDPKRQAAAVKGVATGLAALDKRRGFAKPKAHLEGKELEAWKEKRVKALEGNPPPPEKIVPGVLIKRDGRVFIFDLGIGEAAVREEALARTEIERLNPGDVFDLMVRADGPQHPERMQAVPAGFPQAALVAIDPQTRGVVALVGGSNYTDFPYNRVTQARRQAGSTFKPLVYGAAIETKRFSPATVLVDGPEVWHLDRGKWWTPKNFSGQYRGPVTLRVALANSLNSIAVRLANDVGIPSVHDFARRAGIESPLVDNLTVALGSSEVSPLELTNAFATIAANGRVDRPRMITSVVGPDGEKLKLDLLAESEPKQVIDPAVAFVVRSMMRSVVTEGSGKGLKGFGRPVVGKTGTSNEAKDAWFVGLLPEVAVAAWVGFDAPRTLGGKETGGGAALPMVRTYLQSAESAGPDWGAPPAGVVSVVLDPLTGRLAAEGAEGVAEYFLAGTEPTDEAPAAGEVDSANFFFQETGLGEPTPTPLPADAGAPPPSSVGGGDIHVPSVDVAPVPGSLLPATPVQADPAPLPDRPDPEAMDEPADEEDRPD